MTLAIEPIVYQVFSEGAHRGNCAQVIPSPAIQPRIQPDWNAVSACSVVDLSNIEPHASQAPVHWFGPQGAIAYCGHGALAIAAYLADQQGYSDVRQLLFPAGGYNIKSCDGVFWFSQAFPALPEMTNANPLSYQRLIDAPSQTKADLETPVEAVEVGGEQGYVILRMPDNYDLTLITPRVAEILSTTERAMILTATLDNTSTGNYDYSLRYFAPQYGAIEDPATGSANLILARFWYERLPRAQYRVYQASSAGAVIHVQCSAHEYWIGGTVKRVTRKVEV